MRNHLAALRILLLLTLLCGVAYPAVVTAVAQLPGLHANAEGNDLLIGQDFKNLPQYFQSRPSASDYDPTASGASNLGPENLTLLDEVCRRSYAVGRFEHVDGSRPFCTADGHGAVLAVFWSGPGYAGRVLRAVSADQPCPDKPFVASYDGTPVTCADGSDLSAAQTVPVRGDAPADPVVPADAVTASGSGLDPDISVAYADLQVPRVAAARHLTTAQVLAEVRKATTGRALGFLGDPAVNVLQLNQSLDRLHT